MKVLFVPPMSYPLHKGGFESQVSHIYNELLQLGVDVQWYSLSGTDFSQYDIIHFHSSVTEFVPIATKAKDLGKKIVITPMIGSPRYSNLSYLVKYYASNMPGLFFVMKRFRQFYSMADSFITLTNFEKNRLESVFKIKKEITIVPNGIDDTYFSKDCKDINLPFDNFIIVVGRIEPDKNQLPLIEIVNELNLNLLIVGEPGAGHNDYYNLCKAKSGKNVCFWGSETNPSVMSALYRKATMTAIPSVSEMLPLVIFESLSQQTPVLCTTHCGLYPEKINGVYYTKPTKLDMYKKIKKLMSRMTSEIIDPQNIFSWKDIAEQHVKIYSRLMQ